MGQENVSYAEGTWGHFILALRGVRGRRLDFKSTSLLLSRKCFEVADGLMDPMGSEKFNVNAGSF